MLAAIDDLQNWPNWNHHGGTYLRGAASAFMAQTLNLNLDHNEECVSYHLFNWSTNLLRNNSKMGCMSVTTLAGFLYVQPCLTSFASSGGRIHVFLTIHRLLASAAGAFQVNKRGISGTVYAQILWPKLMVKSTRISYFEWLLYHLMIWHQCRLGMSSKAHLQPASESPVCCNVLLLRFGLLSMDDKCC